VIELERSLSLRAGIEEDGIEAVEIGTQRDTRRDK
jgi:hypothetical protein